MSPSDAASARSRKASRALAAGRPAKSSQSGSALAGMATQTTINTQATDSR